MPPFLQLPTRSRRIYLPSTSLNNNKKNHHQDLSSLNNKNNAENNHDNNDSNNMFLLWSLSSSLQSIYMKNNRKQKSFSFAFGAPTLNNIESRVKNYFYTVMPPGNPGVIVTRTLAVSGTRDITRAVVEIHNATYYDLLTASSYPSVEKSQYGTVFLPNYVPKEDGTGALYISGNGTAAEWTSILRGITYKAPLTYNPSHELEFWRNVSFTVFSGDEQSNKVYRNLWVQGAYKVLNEDYSGELNDIGFYSRYAGSIRW